MNKNKFMKDYFSRNHYFDKNNFKNYIRNSNNTNFLVLDKINDLKSTIRSTYHNNPKKLFKKSKYLKNNLSNIKSGIPLKTNIFNSNHFLREFESLFENTTNNNLVEYFNGQEVEHMGDFVKKIKEFNYNDFMKKIKRKKSKNKKAYNKLRDFSAKPLNFKGSSYSFISSRKSLNENNCSDIYLNTTNASEYVNTLKNESKNNFGKSFNNLKLDLDDYVTFGPFKRQINFDLNKNRRNNRNLSQYKNEVERIKLFGNKAKYRTFSYNNKVKQNNIDKFIYHCKTLRNLI